MRAYEVMVIIAPSLDEVAIEAAVAKIVRLIEDGGGTVDNLNPWGKRRLAYEIAEQREGFYVVVEFHADGATVAEMNRVLRLSDDVLRHLVVVAEEPARAAEEPPAPNQEPEQVSVEG